MKTQQQKDNDNNVITIMAVIANNTIIQRIEYSELYESSLST